MGLEVYQEQVLRTPGLKHYWSFDGESLADLYGGIALTSPAPGSYVPGRVGDKAMLFNGTTQYLMTASPIDLTAYNSVALMFWWYPNVYDLVNAEIISELSENYNLNATAFLISTEGATANDPFGISLKGDIGYNKALYNNNTFSWSTPMWRHMVGILDKSLATNEVSTYNNGSLATPSSRPNNSNNANNFGNHTLYLASRAGLYSVNHTLDEVALFAPAPTAQQILDIYNSYPTRHGVFGRSIGRGLIA